MGMSLLKSRFNPFLSLFLLLLGLIFSVKVAIMMTPRAGSSSESISHVKRKNLEFWIVLDCRE